MDIIEDLKTQVQARIDLNEYFYEKEQLPTDYGRVQEDKFYLRLLEQYESKKDKYMEQEKDYKKLYKDALELTRQKHEQARKDNNPIYCIYEEIFPQLAESDDEKIGKELFEFFSSALGKDLLQRKCGLNPDKVLSWFEKQKEREEGDRTYEAKIYWKGRSDAMEQKEQKHYWKPTENDVALFSKAVTTNEMLTPAERAQLDIIRSKFGYCRAVNCNGIVQKEQNPVEYTLQSSWDTSNKQEPTEWSKEDEKDIAHIIRVLDDCYAYGKHDLSKTDHENLTNTLKSLRPHWKPKLGDKDEFAFTLSSCLMVDSELTEKQANAFTDAYGEDLYKVAIGELDPGVCEEDIEEYLDRKKDGHAVESVTVNGLPPVTENKVTDITPWKPTKKQMDKLYAYAYGCPDSKDAEVLFSLCDDLNALCENKPLHWNKNVTDGLTEDKDLLNALVGLINWSGTPWSETDKDRFICFLNTKFDEKESAWRPNEEQMDYLNRAANKLNNIGFMWMAGKLRWLRDDLEKNFDILEYGKE